MFLSEVESLKSLCNLDIGSFSAKKLNIEFANPTLPSEFSKSIGFILCGIVDEPTSFFIALTIKISLAIYIHISLFRSLIILLMRIRT